VIRGFVDEGRPFITGTLSIPRLNFVSQIPFLVDTGSDTSIVHPRDAMKLGILHDLHFAGSDLGLSSGIGGNVAEYDEPCELLLEHEDGASERLLVSMGFAAPTVANFGFPSLMGRDILRYYRLTFEELRGLVTLESTTA
jgi:hypothetical protein